MLLILAISFALAVVTPWIVDRFGPKTFYALALVPAGTFVATAIALPTILDGGEIRETVPWIPALDIALSFRLDALSVVLALVVSGVGALVLAYCASYFSRDEPSLGRFAALLSAFAGVMYGLVTADDVIILFVFWEATSVLSFLLIGFHADSPHARRSALMSLRVTAGGGLALHAAILLIDSEDHSFLIGVEHLRATVAAMLQYEKLIHCNHSHAACSG